MKNNWAKHVTKFAKKNGMDLSEAMKNKECKKEWQKMKKSGGHPITGSDSSDDESSNTDKVPSDATSDAASTPEVLSAASTPEVLSAASTPEVLSAASTPEVMTEVPTEVPTSDDKKMPGGGRRKAKKMGGKKSKKMLRKSMKLKNKSRKYRK